MAAERTQTTGPLRSLLVPIDLTPSSDRVVGRLMLLPLAEGARVTLLHVVPGSLPHAEERAALRDARRAMTEEARHLRALMLGRLAPKKVIIEPMVRSGSAATEIASCADETGAELIVMGRCGTSPMRDAFLGSTAERVIRQARLPVLVVRLPARRSYARPALALDFDPAAREAIGFMLRVLPPPHPVVDVIHAFNTPYHGVVYPSLPDDVARHAKEELRVSATTELRKLLATALEKARVERRDAPVWRAHARYGWPRYVVEKIVTKAESDLLVLGTRAHSGAAHLFLGTVAGDLLRAAKCDVLLVPPAPARAPKVKRRPTA